MRLEELNQILEDLYLNGKKEIAYEILKKNINENIILGEYEELNNNLLELDENDILEFENLLNEDLDKELLDLEDNFEMDSKDMDLNHKLKELTDKGLSQEELDKEISKLMGEDLNLEDEFDILSDEDILELEKKEDDEEDK